MKTERIPATIKKYLAKRGVFRDVIPADPPARPIASVVVIPAMREAAYVPATLASLAASPAAELEKTLVLVVVNRPVSSSRDVEADNQGTLDWLARDGAATLPDLRWVDATSPGRELPGHGGVGLARRIGCDSALKLLSQNESADLAPLILAHLDADTVAAEDYVTQLHRLPAGRLAFTFSYSHSPAESAAAQAAIDAYELYLTYMVTGLRRAGSPYAFQTVGSAMASTAEMYCLAGGMPVKRQAGEDFYFLQECAKVGNVIDAPKVRVFPSPRISRRVPFGTGPRMAEALEADVAQTAPDPQAFQELETFLRLLDTACVQRPPALTECLPDWVGSVEALNKLDVVWGKLSRQCKTADHLRREFDRWFDGLATIRFIRQRGERDRSPLPVHEAWETLTALKPNHLI
ncbi:MAG: hypothetical protein RRC34_01905 [Lentisphaeria bacterium]|nr:hypothetical protein [Lentisphaeria bacterium]